MSTRCDVCGLESTLDEAFHRIRITRRKSRIYCPACQLKSTTFHLKLFLVYGCLAGALGLLGPYLFDKNPWSWNLLAFCLFVIFEVLCVVPHELGHAVAAWFMGMRVFTICIGSFGRNLYSFRFFGHDIVLRSIPLGGSTLAVPKDLRLFRSKLLVFYSGGPLANCALIVAAELIYERMYPSAMAEWVLGVFIWSNLIILAVNLWPSTTLLNGQQVPRDGLAILTVLFYSQEKIQRMHACYFYLEGLESRERGKLEEAQSWFVQGLTHYPLQPFSYVGLGLIYLDQERYAEAREAFFQLLKLPSLSPEVEAMIWNDIAWTDLMLGQEELREEANTLSGQAYERIPWNSSVQGTRGSVLVDGGQIEQGIALLKLAMAGNELGTNRAFNACYLSRAMIRRGNWAEAERYLEDARRLNPACPLISRVTRELGDKDKVIAT